MCVNKSISCSIVTVLWGIQNVALNFLQQLLQILTDFDNFCSDTKSSASGDGELPRSVEHNVNTEYK